MRQKKKGLALDKVYFGDCLKLMKEIPDHSIDMILADLPYGTTKCAWDTPIDMEALWKQYKRIIKENGAIVLFAQTPFDKVLGTGNLEMLRYEWVWEKTQATGHLNAKKMPLKAHENLLVFYKKTPIYNPQKTIGHVRKVVTAKHGRNSKQSQIYGEQKQRVAYESTDRFPRSVLTFPLDTQKDNRHSTQKPVALLVYMIKTYTNPGMVVLDNVAGSGSTGVACILTDRRYILMEKDRKIYEDCVQRIHECLQKKSMELF